MRDDIPCELASMWWTNAAHDLDVALLLLSHPECGVHEVMLNAVAARQDGETRQPKPRYDVQIEAGVLQDKSTGPSKLVPVRAGGALQGTVSCVLPERTKMHF